MMMVLTHFVNSVIILAPLARHLWSVAHATVHYYVTWTYQQEKKIVYVLQGHMNL